MTKVLLDQVKKLRQQTGTGVMSCRQALEVCNGDSKKARDWLRQKGATLAEKRKDRVAQAGLVETYCHNDNRIAAVVELNCETDFVARTEEFKKLAHELAMQVAAMAPATVRELLAQPYIRDEKITVGDLVKQTIAKTGEKIIINRIVRLELGR